MTQSSSTYGMTRPQQPSTVIAHDDVHRIFVAYTMAIHYLRGQKKNLEADKLKEERNRICRSLGYWKKETEDNGPT